MTLPDHTQLFVLPDSYSICRFSHDSDAWKQFKPADHWFFSITRTFRELSIVCRSDLAPEGHEARTAGYRCIGIDAKIDFEQVGVLSGLIRPLAKAGISVFTVSTFDTDYILVREATFDRAKDVLTATGYAFKQF